MGNVTQSLLRYTPPRIPSTPVVTGTSSLNPQRFVYRSCRALAPRGQHTEYGYALLNTYTKGVSISLMPCFAMTLATGQEGRNRDLDVVWFSLDHPLSSLFVMLIALRELLG